jgi:hypothetical protein
MSVNPDYNGVGVTPQAGDIIRTVMKSGNSIYELVSEVRDGVIRTAGGRRRGTSVAAFMRLESPVRVKYYFPYDDPIWLQAARMMQQTHEKRINDSNVKAGPRLRLAQELDELEKFINDKETKASSDPRGSVHVGMDLAKGDDSTGILRSPHLHKPGSPVRGEPSAAPERDMESDDSVSEKLRHAGLRPELYAPFAATAIDYERREHNERMESLRRSLLNSNPFSVYRGRREGGSIWDEAAIFGSAMAHINWPEQWNILTKPTRNDAMKKIIDRRTIILGADLATVTTLDGHLNLLRQIKDRRAELTAVDVKSEAITHQLGQLAEAEALVVEAMDAQHSAGE